MSEHTTLATTVAEMMPLLDQARRALAQTQAHENVFTLES